MLNPLKQKLIMADYSVISENDKQFADEFSRFVNGKMSSAKKTGIELANDHRFLVQEKFKVAMYFIEHLKEQELYFPTI